MKDVEEITCYKTSDGKLFEDKRFARLHQKDVDDLEKADMILNEGGSIADCLRAFGVTEIEPVLEKVTKETKLVIRHWQCKNIPGYKVLFWESKTSLRVGGEVGAWSGYYSSTVNLCDLARYAQDAGTIF